MYNVNKLYRYKIRDQIWYQILKYVKFSFTDCEKTGIVLPQGSNLDIPVFRAIRALLIRPS